MLHKQTVNESLLTVLYQLLAQNSLSGFVLVGGTALSLQIGNRKSIDIDLFTTDSFDASILSEELSESLGFVTQNRFKNGLMGRIGDIKVDLISHRYPWVSPIVTEEKIPMASLADIAAMKLNAISGNGSRLKDYVDVAFLGQYFSIDQMVDYYTKKYPNVNAIMALKSLCYFDDIDFDVEISYTSVPLTWPQIHNRITEMVRISSKKFNSSIA